MNQKVSGCHFDKRLLKAVCLTVFEQPVKFRFFQWIIGVGCKCILGAEVAQSCMGRDGGHKKASRVVKHREAMIWEKDNIFFLMANYLLMYCLLS